MRFLVVGLVVLFLISLSSLVQSLPNETYVFEDVDFNKNVKFLFETVDLQGKDLYYMITESPADVYKSSTAEFWTQLAVGESVVPLRNIYSITADNSGTVYISGGNSSFDGFVFKSRDDGWNWEQVGTSFTNHPRTKVKFIDGNLYRWDATLGLYYLNNNQWSQFFLSGDPIDMVDYFGKPYLVANRNGITKFYKIENSIATERGSLPTTDRAEWNQANNPDIAASDGRLYMITEKTSGSGGSIYRSLDAGATWEKMYDLDSKPRSIDAKFRHGIYVVTGDGKIYKSWDGGNWTQVPVTATSGGDVLTTSRSHTNLFALDNKIYRSVSNTAPHLKSQHYSTDNNKVKIGRQIDIDYNREEYEGDNVTLDWSQISGPGVSLVTDQLGTHFTPQEAGTYVFRVIAEDDWIDPPGKIISKGLLTIEVPPPNVPIITIKTQITCTINENCILTSNVTDQQGGSVNVEWKQLSGPAINWLTEKTSETVTFKAFVVDSYEFSVKATNQENLTSTKNVTVNVVELEETPKINDTNQTEPVKGNLTKPEMNQTDGGSEPVQPITNQPVVQTQPEVESGVGSPVILTSAGVDPHGERVTYNWEQIGGEPVTLINPNSATPSFTPTKPGIYTFEVTVTNKDGVKSEPKRVKVTVSGSLENKTGVSSGPQKIDLNSILLIVGVIVIIVVIGLVVWKFKLSKKPKKKK